MLLRPTDWSNGQLNPDAGMAMNIPGMLVLTATITPPDGVPNLKRNDPVLRRKDYIDALRFYLEMPTHVIDRIVFIENSQSDLSDLRELVARESGGKTIEFVSFAGLDYPSAYGRAYGEFKMLDYCLRHSRLLGELGEHEYFWKVTGRLKVCNLPSLMQMAPPQYALLIDFLRWPTPMVDLRLLSCSKGGYRQLLDGRYRDLREDQTGMSAEGYFYLQWIGRIAELGIVPRHRRQPRISGVGGQHNVDYYAGAGVAKYWGRVLARAFIPSLWI